MNKQKKFLEVNMYNKRFFISILIFLCISCNNSSNNTSPVVNSTSSIVSKKSLDYKIHNNAIEIKAYDSTNHCINIKLLNTNGVRTIKTIDTYNFIGPKTVSLDVDSIIRCNNHQLELAYKLTLNPQLPLLITIDNNTNIDFNYNYAPAPIEENSYANLMSGKAGRLIKGGYKSPKFEDIKKWLYDNGNFMEDKDIQSMCNIYRNLSYKNENVYCIEDINSVPIIKDLSGNKYLIKTNMVADYYYLFATNDSKDLTDFIRDVISENFPGSLSSPNKAFSCYRSKNMGGLLTMCLIGIDKEWNKQIIPVGVVCIDNKPPHIITKGESISKEDFGDVYRRSIRSLSSSKSRTDNNITNTKTVTTSNGFIPITNEFKALGFSIQGIPNMDISEQITVSGNEFYGHTAEFTIDFKSDVKSITFKYKDVKRKVNLLDKKSPYTYRCVLPLNLGDNYIEISAEDKFGNSFETIKDPDIAAKILYQCHFYVKMVRTKDDTPDININVNNNIDVDVNVW